MIKNNSKVCSHYKPLSILPSNCTGESCSHCEYYSAKGCQKNFYDALEYADGDI